MTQFRSYDRSELRMDTRPVVLTGDNGAGKTNVLEAISLLGPGRGLRRARLPQLPHQASSGSIDVAEQAQTPWGVAATVETPDGAVELGTGVQPSISERRVGRIDGEPAQSLNALSRIVRLVWITPAMDGLFMEAASGRRRFLDRLVLAVDPEHGGRVSAFERAMRERNALLRDGEKDAGWLSSLEAVMAENGVAMAAARRDLVAKLRGVLTDASAFPKADLGLEGPLEAAVEASAAVDVEEGYANRLAGARPLDAAAGRTLEGPHLTDLAVFHRDKAIEASACSTGEQKALLIGIVLAHARLLAIHGYGPNPILLLDEIGAHLDKRRRELLFEELDLLGLQAWMTGADSGLFSDLGDRAQHFRIEAGRVIPVAI
jgi:DNA replication and repair protein RecF